jgi:hypothetical protein
MCKISLISGHEEEEEASQTLMLKFFFFAYSAAPSGTARAAARRNHIADVKIKTAISWNLEKLCAAATECRVSQFLFASAFHWLANVIGRPD